VTTPLTEDQIEEYRVKYLRIAHVVLPYAELIFRKPTRAEWKQYLAKLLNDSTKHEAPEWLARVTVVHPDREGFGVLLEDYPGAAMAVAKQVIELSGMVATEEGK